MKKVFLYSAALIFSCLTSLTHAQQPKELIIGFDDFPPITYVDEQGQSQGTALNYAQQVLEELGYRVKFRALPSARLYKELISGKVNIWMGALGKSELKNHTLESRYSIEQINLALYYPLEQVTPSLPYDLKNKKIITIKGFSYWEKVNTWLNDKDLNIKVIQASSHTSAIAMLLKKRGDFLLSYQEPMSFTRQALGIESLQLPFIVLQKIPLSFILSKQTPHAHSIMQAIDAHLAQSGLHILETEKEP